MHLALAPRRRLQASYGAAAPGLLAAIELAVAAREAAGIATRAYDPEDGLADLGIAPAPLEPTALSAQLGAISEALLLRGAIIESLWIVGGPGAVPFATLPNPMPDRDGPLLTDAPYALAGLAEPMARWPVGRTPDADPPQPGLLPALLRQTAAAHAAGPRAEGATLALSAARWAAVTAQVIADIPQVALSQTPPLRASGTEARSLEDARLIYCNLHGIRGGDAWYGQAPDDSELVPAVRPADVAGLRLDRALVITQACFGARLAPVGEQPSLAPTLLAAGASGVIGALGLTYGAPDPPPGESDLLAQALLRALQPAGVRLGEALMAAQASTLRTVLRQRGGPDADDLKTLLGFVLYGDPALLVT
jgi:hypothetical protein